MSNETPKSDNTNVVSLFKPDTPQPSVEQILEDAKNEFKDVVLIGYDKDGRLSFITGGDLTWSDVSFMMSVFLQRLHSGEYTDPDYDS